MGWAVFPHISLEDPKGSIRMFGTVGSTSHERI